MYVFSVGLGSTLAFFSAYFFDILVSLALNSAAYAQSFISTGWTVARDIANMGFVLALIYIAYTIMLRAESSGTMRMLAWVVIVALIINFSFFFTRLVIDAGNILAVQFYNAIPTDRTLEQTLRGDVTGGSAVATTANWIVDGTLARTKDLTFPIMQGLQLQNLFNNDRFANWYNGLGRGAGAFMTAFLTLSMVYIAVGAMYFILAVMFLTAGVKFLFRIVVLWFLIIISPLAFLSKTTNLSEPYYDRWQKELIKHTFYPVVFLFIYLFIALVMASLNTNGPGGLVQSIFTDLERMKTVADASSGIMVLIAGLANVAIRLGFVVAMLYIAMKAADVVGVYGATAAKHFAGWVSRGGTSAIFGGGAWALRNTVGAAGYAAAQSKWARAAATTAPGRLLQNTLAGVGRRTFDPRNAPGVRKGLGLIGVDTAEAKRGVGGYESSVEKLVQLRDKQSKALKPTEYQLDQAFKAEIADLPEDQRTALATAAKEYADVQEQRKNNEATNADVKAKKDALKDALDATKIDDKNVIDRAKDRAGANFSKGFNANIARLGWHNLGGIASSGIPGWIARGDREAGAKFRESKDDRGRLNNILKEIAKPTPVIGPGGSAFKPQTMAERLAAAPNAERRAEMQEAQQAMHGWASDLEAKVSATQERIADQQEHIAERLEKIDTKLSQAPQAPQTPKVQTSFVTTPTSKMEEPSGKGDSGKIVEELRKTRGAIKQGIKEGLGEVAHKLDTIESNQYEPPAAQKPEEKKGEEPENDGTVK